MIISGDFNYKKVDNSSYLETYNDFMANIVTSNSSSEKVLASPLFARLEGQTKFYEKLQKYLQLNAILKEDLNSKVLISQSDWILYRPLHNQFGGRVKCENTKILKKIFKTIIRFSFWFLLHFGYWLYSKFIESIPRNFNVVIRTYFVPRSVDKVSGLRRDEYMGDLSDDIMINCKCLLLFSIVDWRDFKLYMFSKQPSQSSSALIHIFLSFSDLILVFLDLLNSKIKFNQNMIYENNDICELINEACLEEYLSMRSFFYFLEKRVARRLMKRNVKCILWPYENQNWEKTYALEKKRIGSTINLKGIQHTGISYKLLNYYPSNIDLKMDFFPDQIFTVGNIILEEFKRWNWGNVEINVCGAIRHGYFKNAKKENIIAKNNKTIVYAFSYDIKLYSKVIKDLIDVFSETSFKVILRYHPLYRKENVRNIISYSLPDNFDDHMDKTWSEVYQAADLILYDDNTIGLEGLLYGVKTLYYTDSDPFYDSTRLFGFNKWKTYISKKDLISVVASREEYEKIIRFDYKLACEYLDRYFSKYIKGHGWKRVINE